MSPVYRLLALMTWSAFCVLLLGLLKIFLVKTANRLPLIYHAGVLKIFSLKITQLGSMRSDRPTLFISNHISYLDIFVLGAVIDGSFVAKAEVSKWPIVGFMAKLQRTIFIERQRRSSTGEQRNMLQLRLEESDNVILFPEGTSHDGARVLSFKSALFAAAEREIDGSPVMIQPVSIAYTTMDGLPLTRAQRSTVAWYGDMSLLPHIIQFLKASRTGVTLKFHEPTSIKEHQNRRKLASFCYQVVADGVQDVIYDRNPAANHSLAHTGYNQSKP
ncbi:MAG: lysophospholipid acyltransferase family protein [Rhodospirillales bacterium]